MLVREHLKSQPHNLEAKRHNGSFAGPVIDYRAAKLMGKGNSKDAAEWLSKSVADGSIPAERITRQTHVFDRRDFPMEVWPLILPK